MKIFSAEQLYQADKQTLIAQNITASELMERAGEQIFNWMLQEWSGTKVQIHIFCGVGNNGGDGLVVGRLLLQRGFHVCVYVVNYSENKSEEFLINYDRLLAVAENPPIFIKSESDFPTIEPTAIIVDAIFGIGLNRSPSGWIKKLIQHLNAGEGFKLAIDLPSGLFANSPPDDFDAIFRADRTLTFHAPKLSFLLPNTGPYVREFTSLDIGLDSQFLNEAPPLAQLITKKDAQIMYRSRERFGHKGTYGHALLIAGSYGKMGAAVLATKAAFRIGAGMVTAYVPKCGYSILQTAIPEAMVVTDTCENYISDIQFNIQPSAIGIGMGIGKNPDTVKAIKNLFVNQEIPLVVDADALNNISENRELLKIIPKNAILTPHPGELKRLIGPWKNDYEKLEKVKLFSKEFQVIVVLKGAYTIIFLEDKLYINNTGNPGMGTAGSGDALSGIITGLLCQGYAPQTSALLGVYLHGCAGDITAVQKGEEAIMAGDIIENLGQAYLDLLGPDFRQ